MQHAYAAGGQAHEETQASISASVPRMQQSKLMRYVLQAQQMGPQDPHDTSGFSQAPGYPQQHLTPEQMMLAPGGYALSPLL